MSQMKSQKYLKDTASTYLAVEGSTLKRTLTLVQREEFHEIETLRIMIQLL